MFGEWGYKVIHDDSAPEEKMKLLHRLDVIIVSFERDIRSSEAGFRHWCRRHQESMMTQGEVGMLLYPEFKITIPAVQYDNSAWFTRYRELVVRRQSMTLDRLIQLGVSRRFRNNFFGNHLGTQSYWVSLVRGETSIIPGDHCSQSIDELLERAARAGGVDGNVIKQYFWNVEKAVVPLLRQNETDHLEDMLDDVTFRFVASSSLSDQ